MNTKKMDSKPCPFSAAERRFGDCLKLWRATKKAYFDPEGFRLALNTCIQTMRSVTFLLQKCKPIFPQFEEWYLPWQKTMRDDPLMKWLVAARNVIVKEGDLETHSEVAAAVVESWYEPPTLVMKVPPLQKTEQIALTLSEKLKCSVSKELGILRVERRWVDSRLPHDEILEVLSHCFGMLSKLLLDGHNRLLGDVSAQECQWYQQRTVDPAAMPPCMVRQDTDRTIWLRLSTGRFVHPHAEPMETTKKTYTTAKRRYKKAIEEARENLDDSTGFEAEAKRLFRFAKAVLLKDGYHVPMAFLGYPDGRRVHMVLEIEDREAKYVIFRQLATDVAKTGADSVIIVNETWVGSPEDMAKGIYPADSPTRKEALHLVAANKSGGLFQYTVLFHRDKKGQIVFDDQMVDEGVPNFLLPILSVWSSVRKYKLPVLKKSGTYRIKKTDPCPCRSGKTFENCCEKAISTGVKERAFELFRTEKYEEALAAYRAFLTQYIVWYNEHTIPFVKDGPLEADDLLCVDIDAAIEIIVRIADCLDRLGEARQIDGFLIRCMNIIDDDRYVFCVTAERAFRFLAKGDDEKANEILKGLRSKDVSRMITASAAEKYISLL